MSQMRSPTAGQQAVSTRRERQGGAALLMAMVIVTLVATLASSMVWQQWRAVQIEGAERVRAQASWVLLGALDWARLILREDQRNGGPDHLGEPWAIPLAEARLSTFLATDAKNNSTESDDAPDAFLSGKVEDATAKYNLRNVVGADGELVPNEVAALKRICELAGQSPALGDALAQAFRKAYLATQVGDATALDRLGGEEGRVKAPLLPQSFDQLTWLGVDTLTLERLRPYLVVLPESTKVNVNTASKEVIAAAEGLDLARAGRIVQARQRNPFKGLELLRDVLGMPSFAPTHLSVQSDYFEVRGRLRIDDNAIEQRHLVQRTGGDVVVRSQTRFSGLESADASRSQQ